MIISKEDKYRALKNQGRDVTYLLQIENKLYYLIRCYFLLDYSDQRRCNITKYRYKAICSYWLSLECKLLEARDVYLP